MKSASKGTAIVLNGNHVRITQREYDTLMRRVRKQWVVRNADKRLIQAWAGTPIRPAKDIDVVLHVPKEFPHTPPHIAVITKCFAGEKPIAIVKPPGRRLNRLALLIFSDKTYVQVFKANYAELMFEWQQAEAGGDRGRANFIRYVRAPLSMATCIALQIVSPILTRLLGPIAKLFK